MRLVRPPATSALDANAAHTVDATPSITSGLTGMSVMQTVRATLPWLSVLLVFLIIVTYE